MYVRVILPQQATTTGRTTRGTNERPERPEQRERPERPEQPERPERPESPDVVPGRTAGDELRELARVQREAAADLRRVAQEHGNQVIVRNGVPVPPVPVIAGVDVHTGVPEHGIPPQVVDLAYGFYAMVAVMVIGWPLARAWGRRLERGGAATALSPAMGEQLQRIEQAVDTMALEVERISEAQRYLTKLQAGQVAESAGLPSGDRR